MISKPAPSECFVYITLPGTTELTTAARFELTADRSGVPLGRFVYGKSYLERADAVPLDPVELKLAPRVYETTVMKGVFGALRDASPDYWGRRVIERHVGKAPLAELDYLLHSPDDRAGALGFGLGQKPPAPKRKFNQTINLAKLQAIADAIVNDEELPADDEKVQAEELLLAGTSMGGARPKAVVEDDAGLWIAKFNRPDDKWNNARTEQAMLTLARTCGLTTAESKVVAIGNRDVLLVKRFDREKTDKGYLRARMVSALTLLRTEDSHQARDNWSYVLLVEELRRISAEPKKDAAELFRRMCFNALISNTDDHPRNHAVIAKERDWKLSPAFDLTPTPHVSLEYRDLALICGDEGRFANAKNLLSQSARFLLPSEEANSIITVMRDRVRGTWYDVSRSVGVSEKDCERISAAFAYPGFDLDHIQPVGVN
ncbi:MAG: serine/threonine-protein kinase HipA [Acidobacteriaceae bacterium]|jgi:serine/threonine-protein kinase HipA